MRRIRFKARALKTGNMVEGYYAHQHIANFDADGQHINSYIVYLEHTQQREGRVPERIDAMFKERYGFGFNKS